MPATLWNLAGTLDSLGNHKGAIEIYAWLLQAKNSPKESCRESTAWADALKTDCVYRLGVCFQSLGKEKEAEHYYRHYLDLLLIGRSGMYSAENYQQDTFTPQRQKCVCGRRIRKGREVGNPNVRVYLRQGDVKSLRPFLGVGEFLLVSAGR